jgi:hypothetical protein
MNVIVIAMVTAYVMNVAMRVASARIVAHRPVMVAVAVIMGMGMFMRMLLVPMTMFMGMVMRVLMAVAVVMVMFVGSHNSPPSI